MHPNQFSPSSSQPFTGGVNLNLGTIGRVDWYHLSRLNAPYGLSHQDEYAVVVASNPGLPTPARDLDCQFFKSAVCAPLLVFAAVHHEVAYYVLANTAERSTFTALKAAAQRRRLEVVFTADGHKPSWSAMRLEDAEAKRLERELLARKDDWRTANDVWRDRLALLVLDLPSLIAKIQPEAAACRQHAAVLANGNRHSHHRQVERNLAPR